MLDCDDHGHRSDVASARATECFFPVCSSWKGRWKFRCRSDHGRTGHTRSSLRGPLPRDKRLSAQPLDTTARLKQSTVTSGERKASGPTGPTTPARLGKQMVAVRHSLLPLWGGCGEEVRVLSKSQSSKERAGHCTNNDTQQHAVHSHARDFLHPLSSRPLSTFPRSSCVLLNLSTVKCSVFWSA